MAFQTRFASCASTVATWLTVRETVAVDTLARLATSRMSTCPLLPPSICRNHSIRYPDAVSGSAGRARGRPSYQSLAPVAWPSRRSQWAPGLHGSLQSRRHHGKRLPEFACFPMALSGSQLGHLCLDLPPLPYLRSDGFCVSQCFWWGAILALIGAGYCIRFSPGKGVSER